jgi:hypothetical protein
LLVDWSVTRTHPHLQAKPHRREIPGAFGAGRVSGIAPGVSVFPRRQPIATSNHAPSRRSTRRIPSPRQDAHRSGVTWKLYRQTRRAAADDKVHNQARLAATATVSQRDIPSAESPLPVGASASFPALLQVWRHPHGGIPGSGSLRALVPRLDGRLRTTQAACTVLCAEIRPPSAVSTAQARTGATGEVDRLVRCTWAPTLSRYRRHKLSNGRKVPGAAHEWAGRWSLTARSSVPR